uniref:Integrase, catalytic region, zinc finger, CCHC-type, peptidase aspartic, catalytic n=1 Tax=Tanacetum cinerariifolium TaxID=118510 RepID=A0A699IM49_TANCI|nr:hypothetical protein [Tanacetum cinerariifolium]
MPKVLSLAWETILEIEHAFEDKHCQPEDILELFQRLHNDVQNIHEELTVYINTPSWDRPTICYNDDDDDDDDCTIAITPILSTKEPDNSLNQFEDLFDSNDDSTSSNDDSFSIDDIEYVEASPPNSKLVSLEVMEIVIPKEGGIDADILLKIKDDILSEKLLNINILIANIKALKDNPTPYFDFMTKSSSTSLSFLLDETNTFDNSLPKSKTFGFDLEEISSGSITTRSDISLPDYEAFYYDHVKEISSGRTSLTKQERECKLYDEFNKFAYKKGESLRDFYLRFSLIFNDINIHNMKLEQFQVNTKFLNTLPPEWSKFVTDVKLVRDLHTTNVDQLHAYLGQHEYHANEYASQAQSSTPLSITYLPNDFQSSVHHNVYSSSSSIPQVEYAPPVHQQSDFSQPDTGLVVPVFQKGNDLIDAINHMMSFLIAVVTSRYPLTNNQLRNSSNPRQQATINNERVTIQLIKGDKILWPMVCQDNTNPDQVEKIQGNRGLLVVTTVREKDTCQSNAQGQRGKVRGMV